MHENITAGEIYAYEFLVENCPDDKKRDIDYIMSLLDWEKNVDPALQEDVFPARRCCAPARMGSTSKGGSRYANDYVGAKELTVAPGQTVTHTDKVAFGCIVVQGHGTFAGYEAEAAGMLRFGQPAPTNTS